MVSILIGGGVKSNPLNRFVSEMMEAYNECETLLINYFLIDYCIYIGYTQIPAIRQMIDAVPYNNKQVLYLLKNLYDKPNEEELASVIRSTHVFKTTYKLNFSKLQNDGQLYHKILRGEI